MVPGRSRSESRERMLDAAEALMRERGLAGTGIQQVVARSGAPIGSLYHHFPGGKTELLREALRRHDARARAVLTSALAGDRPLVAKVRALFEGAAEGFEEQGGARSCAIGNVTLAAAPDDPELREACAASFQGWIEAIAELLPFPDTGRRRSFAETIVLAFEGAFVLARASKSGRPFTTAGEWLVACLETDPETGGGTRSVRRKR